MPCFHPIPARQDGLGGVVKLWPPIGTATLSLPCGSCVGCRTSRALDWARRCVHEASLYRHNSFLTLTYDDAHLPSGGHLVRRDLQLFIKRLRSAALRVGSPVLTDKSQGIRFFGSGEYGEINGRPHYHVLLFNCGFADAVVCGKHLFTSVFLSSLWPLGLAKFGSVTARSANYVAQYSLKKQGGACDVDGVVRPAPFLGMSLKPAIGAGWLSRYAGDLKFGYLVVDGKPCRVPRTYLRKLESEDEAFYESVEVKRAEYVAGVRGDGNDAARLAAGEVIALSRVGKRPL